MIDPNALLEENKRLRRQINKMRVLAWEHESRCNKYKNLKNAVEDVSEKFGDRGNADFNPKVYEVFLEIISAMEQIDYDPHEHKQVIHIGGKRTCQK